MAGVFNPNMDVPDFEVQMSTNARQQKIADALRKVANESRVGPGRMEGNSYVPTSVFQHLNSLLQGFNADRAENEAGRAQEVTNQAMSQGAKDWRSSLPQAIAATQGTPEIPAAPNAEGESVGPAVPSVPGMPAQPVTLQQTMAHYMRGQSNPLLKEEAKSYMDYGFKEAEQNQRLEQAKEVKTAQLAESKARLDEAIRNNNMQEANRIRDDIRSQAAHESNQVFKTAMLAVAQQNAGSLQQWRERADKTDNTAATDRAEATQQRDTDKHVAGLATQAKPLIGLVEGGARVQQMLDNYGDKPVPGIGHNALVPNWMASNEAVANRTAVNQFAASMITSEAGLSQTLSEAERQKLVLLTKPDFSEKDFKDNWPWIRAKLNSQVSNTFAGRPKAAVEAYKMNGGTLRTVQPKAATAKPVGGLSEAEAQELAELKARFPGGAK